jgi:hypothetical protein
MLLTAGQHATQMWTLQLGPSSWNSWVAACLAPGRNPKHAWNALNPVLKAVVERMIFTYIKLACTNSLYTHHAQQGAFAPAP